VSIWIHAAAARARFLSKATALNSTVGELMRNNISISWATIVIVIVRVIVIVIVIVIVRVIVRVKV
jgi:hypothetical protein